MIPGLPDTASQRNWEIDQHVH